MLSHRVVILGRHTWFLLMLLCHILAPVHGVMHVSKDVCHRLQKVIQNASPHHLRDGFLFCYVISPPSPVASWKLYRGGVAAPFSRQPGGEGAVERQRPVREYLSRVAERMHPENGVAVVLVSMHDLGSLPEAAHIALRKVGVPFLVFNGREDDSRSVLIPDSYFLASKGYADVRKRLQQMGSQQEWHIKQTSAIWRGSTTGPPERLTPSTWWMLPRLRLCLLAADPRIEGKLDAGVTSIVQASPSIKTVIEGYRIPEILPEGFPDVIYAATNETGRHLLDDGSSSGLDDTPTEDVIEEVGPALREYDRRQEEDIRPRASRRHAHGRDQKLRIRAERGGNIPGSLLKSHLGYEEMLAHKVLVDIDGNANSWGVFWKLHSNSVTLKVICGFRQWYYLNLMAWKHYIPVKCDMSDLVENLQWALAVENEAKMQLIAEESTALMSKITYTKEVKSLSWLLRSNFSFPRSRHPLIGFMV
ncbi:hypothetical protein CYMTET_5251 [Cymbomonas tetramitiformis]|uniref:Glycosyl transferase CAP10 domain-containing protein n=1 Tax=Cymbomonas tetramitiformis TaxID=36881 RepID=A0AAE0GZG5_9CHLO|nr:hypothetical protein CYMTET_5251 [Cymbomonas tetramitiformis]